MRSGPRSTAAETREVPRSTLRRDTLDERGHIERHCVEGLDACVRLAVRTETEPPAFHSLERLDLRRVRVHEPEVLHAHLEVDVRLAPAIEGGGRPSRLLRSASIRCRRRFTFVTRCGFDSLMRASMALLSRSLGFDACTMHGLARLDFAGLFLSPHRRHRAWASLRGASRPPRSLGLWRHGVGRDERERGNGRTSDATLTIRIHAMVSAYARPRTAGRFADEAS